MNNINLDADSRLHDLSGLVVEARESDVRAYLVYGDAKNTYRSTVFTKADCSVVTEHELARLVLADGSVIEGAVLSQNSDETDQWPAHVSILVSEFDPGDVLTRVLQEQGWQITERAPRGVTVPFSVDAILLAHTQEGTPTYFATFWAQKGFAPLQRTSVRVPGGSEELQIRVLDYFTGESGRPQVIATLAPESAPDTSFSPLAGWNGPVPELSDPEWISRAHLSDAVETKVDYLLGTPVVTGVTITDPAALQNVNPQTVSSLPGDIREEAGEAFLAAGHPDLSEACQT